jgi:hypothetical protein
MDTDIMLRILPSGIEWQIYQWWLLTDTKSINKQQLNKETYDSEDDQGNSCKQHHSAMHEDIIYKL